MLYEVMIKLGNSLIIVNIQPFPDNIIWQKDGAPPHNRKIVRGFLNDKFNKCIGRWGTTQWPACSPDLSPMDFSVWGIMKDRVYSEKNWDLEHLKERITSDSDKKSSRTLLMLYVLLY